MVGNINALSTSLNALTTSFQDIIINVGEDCNRSWGRFSSVTMDDFIHPYLLERYHSLSCQLDSLLGDERYLHSLTMSSYTAESSFEPGDLLTALPSWKKNMLEYKICDVSNSNNDSSFVRHSHEQSRLSEHNQSLLTIDESLSFAENDRTDKKDVSFDGNKAEFFSWDDSPSDF